MAHINCCITPVEHIVLSRLIRIVQCAAAQNEVMFFARRRDSARRAFSSDTKSKNSTTFSNNGRYGHRVSFEADPAGCLTVILNHYCTRFLHVDSFLICTHNFCLCTALPTALRQLSPSTSTHHPSPPTVPTSNPPIAFSKFSFAHLRSFSSKLPG